MFLSFKKWEGEDRWDQFGCPGCIWLVRLLGQNASYVLKVTLKRNPYVNVFKGWLYLRAFKWPLFEHDGLGKSLTYQLRFKATPSKYMAKKTFKKWRIKKLCFFVQCQNVWIFWFLDFLIEWQLLQIVFILQWVQFPFSDIKFSDNLRFSGYFTKTIFQFTR